MLQELKEPMQKYKTLNLKTYMMQHTLKYKILLKFTPKRAQWRNYIGPVPPFGRTKLHRTSNAIWSNKIT
jgi:hypothetical protein